MIIGIIITVLFILICFKFFTRRCKNKKVDAIMGKLHKVLGFVLLITTFIHMIVVLPLMKQRPVSMYITGILMLSCSIAAILSYYFRKKLKKSWILIHRTATTILMVCLVFHIFAGIRSLNTYQAEIANIQINNINVKSIANGQYIGECNVGYIYAKVELTINNGKIENAVLLEHRNEKGGKAEAIIDSIMNEQKIKVDAISGATNSSKVIMKAVENAITKEK